MALDPPSVSGTVASSVPDAASADAAQAAAWAQARRLAETTTTSLSTIARRCGIQVRDLKAVVAAERWPRPHRRRAVSRSALIERLWQAADGQLVQIEARLAEAGLPPADADGVARSLATVVKTIHDLARIDEAAGAATRRRRGAEPEEAPIRDADDLRRRLAQRLDRLRGEG